MQSSGPGTNFRRDSLTCSPSSAYRPLVLQVRQEAEDARRAEEDKAKRAAAAAAGDLEVCLPRSLLRLFFSPFFFFLLPKRALRLEPEPPFIWRALVFYSFLS